MSTDRYDLPGDYKPPAPDTTDEDRLVPARVYALILSWPAAAEQQRHPEGDPA